MHAGCAASVVALIKSTSRNIDWDTSTLQLPEVIVQPVVAESADSPSLSSPVVFIDGQLLAHDWSDVEQKKDGFDEQSLIASGVIGENFLVS